MKHGLVVSCENACTVAYWGWVLESHNAISLLFFRNLGLVSLERKTTFQDQVMVGCWYLQIENADYKYVNDVILCQT